MAADDYDQEREIREYVELALPRLLQASDEELLAEIGESPRSLRSYSSAASPLNSALSLVALILYGLLLYLTVPPVEWGWLPSPPEAWKAEHPWVVPVLITAMLVVAGPLILSLVSQRFQLFQSTTDVGNTMLATNLVIRRIVCEAANRRIITRTLDASNIAALAAMIAPAWGGGAPSSAPPAPVIAFAVLVLRLGLNEYCRGNTRLRRRKATVKKNSRDS